MGRGRVSGLGRVDEAAVAANLRGALSLAAHLGIQDAPSVHVEKPLWIVRSEVLRAPVTGLWQPAVDQKDSVATGALIGRISDPFGKVLAEVRSPFAGEMLYVVATPPVEQGQPLGFVGQVVEGGPAGPVRE